MILPTKHCPIAKSMLGTGAVLLGALDRPLTLSRLWEKMRYEVPKLNYERFLLTLDLLYAFGTIDLIDGFVRRTKS